MTTIKKIAVPLFHATVDVFDKPHPGDDLAFWTTESSAIAQTYLPASQGTIQTKHIFSSDLDKPVAPNRADPLYAVVLQMGFEATDIVHDRNGVASKWQQPAGYPTYGDVVRHIEDELGYRSAHPTIKSFHLQSETWDSRRHQNVIVPANYKKQGYLWVVTGHEKMRFFDLTDPATHAPDNLPSGQPLFARLQAQGYDGVVITDHCQSATRGQIEHRSIGFFAAAVEKLSFQTIPAVHFDWNASDPADLLDSPEYTSLTRAAAAIESARRATMVNYEPDDLVVASRRIRDGRDTVPKGTRGTVLQIADDSFLVQFAGDVMMACTREDLHLREKNARLSAVEPADIPSAISKMRILTT